MEQKLMEIPKDVWNLIARRLNQKDLSSARAVSRVFYQWFTPEWDRYSRDCWKIRAIVAGGNHSLLLTETGELWGCGNNQSGQLGHGHTTNQASWKKLSDKTSIRAIAAGWSHTLLLRPRESFLGVVTIRIINSVWGIPKIKQTGFHSVIEPISAPLQRVVLIAFS
jgi:alpha-tubulin suppressor-like RCC1 family protein